MAINLTAPRLLPTEALTKLPKPASTRGVAEAAKPAGIFAADAKAPLSANQKTMATLALACELQITPSNCHAALVCNHQKIVEQKDAANYIQKVEGKVVPGASLVLLANELPSTLSNYGKVGSVVTFSYSVER